MRRILFILLILMIVSGFVVSQDNIKELEREIKGVLKHVSPSIVKVVSENHKKYIATGIAIDRDLVLTSNLVIRHPYDHIYVRTVDDRKFSAKVQGTDRFSSLTLLKLNDKKMVPIKKSSHLEVGDWVALVGVFYQEFPSIFQGIVSSVSADELILNAPVAPGSSGGAVVNKKGELVAVIRGSFGFAVAPDLSFQDNRSEVILRGLKARNRDLCYAIPVQRVMDITSRLKEFGQIKRGWLGIYLASSPEKGGAVAVTDVAAGSPASRAGIRKGDIIISIDKEKIGSPADVTRIVRATVPAEVVKFGVQRGKKLESVLVKIGQLNEKREYVVKDFGDFRVKVPELRHIPEIRGTLPEIENFVFYLGGSRTLGVDVKRVVKELAERYGAVAGYGLWVKKVHRDSAAEKAGIKEGDIIVKANRQKIRLISDLRQVLNALDDKEAVVLEVERNGKTRKIEAVPLQTKANLFDWRGLKDNLKQFSVEFYDNAGDALRREAQALKSNIQELRTNLRRISGAELEALKVQIDRMKERAQTHYEKALERLARRREKFDEDLTGLRSEFFKLKKEFERRRNESRRKIKQEKENRDGDVI